MLLGYDQRNHEDSDLTQLIDELTRIEKDLDKKENLRDAAIEATDKLKYYNKAYYDKKHKSPTKYQKGDYVLYQRLTAKTGGK